MVDHRAHKRIAREIGHRFPRCWSVISDQSAFSLHRCVQRGDVRVADDWFWGAIERIVVDARQDADQPIAAAQAPDRVDLRITQRVIDVIEPIAIAAGEIPGAICRVRCDDRFPADCARIFQCAREFFRFLQRASGCNERDTRARRERVWTTKMF